MTNFTCACFTALSGISLGCITFVGFLAIGLYLLATQGFSANDLLLRVWNDNRFDGNLEPCKISDDAPAPCDEGRTVQFEGVVPRSVSYPANPPTLEAMLFNSWREESLGEVPEYALLGSTHMVARGRFVADSLSCQGFKVFNPGWAVDHVGLGVKGVPEGARVTVDFQVNHWMCFAEFMVHEYFTGAGGSSLNVNLAVAAVPYETGADFESIYDQRTLDSYRASVTDHFFGSDWVVWLGPSYSTAVEAWTAYSLWDVQKDDDDIVRVVSPVAAHYEEVGLTGSAMDRLRLPLADFRRDIKAAHDSRVERTSGRIGVGTDTPKLVTDVFKLEDYYEEVGAYDYPIATPAPPPTAPYPPTDLYGELWTDPQPEVDLAWTAPVSSQVTTYKIMRVDNLGNEVVVAEIPSEFVEVTDRHLPIAGAEYTYTVIAVNRHGESPPSGTAVIRNGSPNAPIGLWAELQPGNEADLGWDAPPASYVTGYNVERKTGNGAWVTIKDNLSTEYLNSTDWNLQSGVTYTYRVVALNEWSSSAPSAQYVLRVP